MIQDRKDFLEMFEGLDCYETFQLAENLSEEFISKNTPLSKCARVLEYRFAPEDCTFSQLDAYIQSRTHFKSWKDFLYAAWQFNLDSN
jgi:hypothetical protein